MRSDHFRLRIMRLIVAGLFLGFSVSVALTTPASAASTPPIPVGGSSAPGYDQPPAPFGWEGTYRSQEAWFPSRQSGAMLYGTLFAPPLSAGAGPFPGVVILPGSLVGIQSQYAWAGRYLASHGYVALTADPQGVGKSQSVGSCYVGSPPSGSSVGPCPGVPYQQTSNWEDAGESALDYFLSAKNPYGSVVNHSRIGMAGHSLAARAISYLQGVDKRIGAVVAWDNLASNDEGDAGSPTTGPPVSSVGGLQAPGSGNPVVPRVPAMGQASESGSQTASPGSTIKKTAFNLWRSRGVASMELDFAGSAHLDWGQYTEEGQTYNTAAHSLEVETFAYYTVAWFDRFLKGEKRATTRLLATTVLGQPAPGLLSATYLSGAYLPRDGVNTSNLRLCLSQPAGCRGTA